MYHCLYVYELKVQLWSKAHRMFLILGVDELKQAKIDVKTSTFLQFLLYLFMWCHFNGMWIMENCVYWINMDIEKFKMNQTKFQD